MRFALFAVDTRETKAELLKKLNDITTNLSNYLEKFVIEIYNQCLQKYTEIQRKIEKRLHTPEELVEMDKTKIEMHADLYSIQKEFESGNIIYHYMFTIDHILSDNLINITSNVIKRHFDFKNDLES